MTNPRQFGPSQRIAMYLRSGGNCQICNVAIQLGSFHADHIVPWSKGGPTTLSNAQALCAHCNLSKSSTMSVPFGNHLPPGWKLRNWQEEFINRFYSSALQQAGKPPSEIKAFILHAFPGSGKSLAQTLAARTLLEQNVIDQVVICVPSKLLRDQMEDDARKVGLFLNRKRIEVVSGQQGLVVSYAQIGHVNTETGQMVNAELLRQLCQEKRTMVVADEMHHLGMGYNWGDAFELAFNQHSTVRLMTSGTPFRSDQKQLPWVRYREKQIDLSPPHAYSYGYGLSKWNDKYSALGDQVVRDVVFHPWDGQVDFTIKRHESGVVVDERSYSHRMTDNIDELYPDIVDEKTGIKITDNKILRAQIKSRRREACIECGTARHPHGTNYVRDQLVAANETLKECRRAHAWAGGLIVCNSIVHADAVSRALKHWTGESSIVVHNEAGNDARLIREFRETKTAARPKWIVSVAKISEGVDIKHLRVCVYLTKIQAPLRWTQILGRILRTESEIEWDLQTAHQFQYEDGIENIESEDGGIVPESANIKLFAESLLQERWVTLEAIERNQAQLKTASGSSAGLDTYYTTETIQATGVNTQQIYDGVRHENSSLSVFKILAARLQIPEVKIAALIQKGGEDEWRRALEAQS